jgi:hypothetical protein
MTEGSQRIVDWILGRGVLSRVLRFYEDYFFSDISRARVNPKSMS